MTAAARFGAYEILHELSTGGMGAVLLGRRRGPGAFEQLVAIKTIRSEYAGAEAVRAMFLDEAAILARLNHPGVATVHDFGEEAGTLYMEMEYVAGVWAAHGNNISRAAEQSGLSRRHFRELLYKHALLARPADGGDED